MIPFVNQMIEARIQDGSVSRYIIYHTDREERLPEFLDRYNLETMTCIEIMGAYDLIFCEIRDA